MSHINEQSEDIKNLIDELETLYLREDWELYDGLDIAISPFLSEEIREDFDEQLKQMEKRNPVVLQNYIKYFAIEYGADISDEYN